MAGSSFDVNGKTYPIPSLTVGIKDRWHVYCNAYARAQVAKDRRAVEEGWLDYAEFKARADETQDRLDSGYYHHDERGGRAMLAADYTFIALVWMCTASVNPKVTEEEFRKAAALYGPDLGKRFAEANASPTQPAGSAGGDSQQLSKDSGTKSDGDSSASTD